jgi:hypothetical protein
MAASRWPSKVESMRVNCQCRRGFAGHDAELAAVEMQILGLVANLVKAGKSRADIEVDVAEIGVLCGVEADRHCAAIARANFEVDVADG